MNEPKGSQILGTLPNVYVFIPSGALPDGKVQLQVEDDEAQQGQDDCEKELQILFVDLGWKDDKKMLAEADVFLTLL